MNDYPYTYSIYTVKAAKFASEVGCVDTPISGDDLARLKAGVK